MVTGKMGQRIAAIDAKELTIPFRHVFRHASAVRDRAATLWVRVADVDGVAGYGEGCPREYVTRESMASAKEFITNNRAAVMAAVSDPESLIQWMAEHSVTIDQNPAAWCAVELAVLDLLARRMGVPVEDLLGLPRLKGPFKYTAVIGVASAQQFAAMLAQYQQLGINDYKLKLSGDLSRDCDNIDLLRTAQVERVRLDANNLWQDLETARDYLARLDYPFFAIEEPFAAGRLDLMQSLGSALDCKIILDESVLRVDQLDAISALPERWIVNVRVSKMGGLHRALHMVAQCHTRSINVIIGAQVGETSLLTRAALTLANAAGDILVAQEGAFGTYLLESDPCKPELRFTEGGILDIGHHDLANKPGFGLEITT